MQGPAADPAVTLALALAAGMLAQSLARHLRVPGIVVLLLTGAALGPDGCGWVRPQALGHGLEVLVGLAVAVILFEGALRLEGRLLLREARSIRRLVTLGAVVTAGGGALAVRWLLAWPWHLALLFGTLVIVTGPTVITPLLRRIRVRRSIETVLEAEGVFGDAIGSIVAVVGLEMVLGSAGTVGGGIGALLGRIGVGLALGLLGGAVMAGLLRIHWLVPEGLDNATTLALVLALFAGSNAIRPDSGIVAVTVAGLVVANLGSRALKELVEFKEQLTVLFVGMLFVLLAADVRLREIGALGWRAVAVVAVLMFAVRPLNVLASTYGSGLGRNERAFIAWLAPRGIVAAAAASLFAQRLDAEGLPGGHEIRALTFLVIAVTVVFQGLTGRLVARLLGVALTARSGYLILGANALARAFGTALRSAGEEILLIDSSADACHRAQAEGFRVFHGSGLSETVLRRAQPSGRRGALAITSNEAVNLLFAARLREEFKLPRVWVALRRGHDSVTPEMVEARGCRVLFGQPRNLDAWILRLEEGTASVEWWRYGGEQEVPARSTPISAAKALALPLLRRSDDKLHVLDRATSIRPGDEVLLALVAEAAADLRAALSEGGWQPATANTGGAVV